MESSTCACRQKIHMCNVNVSESGTAQDLKIQPWTNTLRKNEDF